MTDPTTSSSTAPEPLLYTTHASALAFATTLLTANGVPPSHASLVASCLAAADLRGIDTHGLNRLPSYITRIRQHVLDPAADPTLTQTTPVVAHVNGNNTFGAVVGHMAMRSAIDMAKVYGIGMVGCSGSNHFGMSAWLVQMAIDEGMMSLVFTNSSPAMPAWGGKERILGVSPLACGAPGAAASTSTPQQQQAGGQGVGQGEAEADAKGKETNPGDLPTAPDPTRPFILDMAPSTAARGKVYKALRRNESIPPDWALDKHGQPTTSPSAALDGGVMLPMGGPKGSGLAIMMDVFSGVLTGSAFAGKVAGPYDPSREADVGHFIVALKPDLFMDLGEFRHRMGVLYQSVVGSERMFGVDRVWFPGEREVVVEEERRRGGIPYVRAEVEALNREADLVGAPHLEVEER